MPVTTVQRATIQTPNGWNELPLPLTIHQTGQNLYLGTNMIFNIIKIYIRGNDILIKHAQGKLQITLSNTNDINEWCTFWKNIGIEVKYKDDNELLKLINDKLSTNEFKLLVSMEYTDSVIQYNIY